VGIIATQPYRSAIACIFVAAALAGCEESNTYVAPPPPKVTVAEPAILDVTDYLEFTGTLVASGDVYVRARVPGVLREMLYQPGTRVQEGDLLFIIDPVEYEAAVDVATADVARAEARKVETGRALERAQTLIQRGNISKAKLDEAEANFKSADADLLAAKATLRRAKINLGYTKVTAPIAGRVGRERVDIGNLVGEGEATVLTDLTQPNPMYVYFSINERDLLRILEVYRQRVREKGIDVAKESQQEADIALQLGLANEDGFPHQGVLDYSDSSLDPTTGTVEVRGVFTNDELPGRLIPGLFARVRMPIEQRSNMPLVSERAVGADQKGPYLLVVTGEDIVERRTVVLGQAIDGLRVIEEGIDPDDQVIVNGLQRARPGAPVDPELVEMETLATSAQMADTPAP